MANSLGRRLAARFRRVILYRLIMPVLRAKHPPEYTARSVFIGLLVAMTPTVGIQMPIVLLVWFAIRYTKRQWDFNVIIAMAWTWVTNVFTLGPIYYLFLVSGRMMLGEPGDLSGYSEFIGMLKQTLSADTGFFESLWTYTVDLFRIWGAPMFLGSVPWAIASAFIGYRWSLKLVQRVRVRRMRKRLLHKREPLV